MNKHYVIVASSKDYDGRPAKYIGLDQGSGGYPYEAESPWNAKIWREDEIDEMLKYFKMFYGAGQVPGRVWEINEIDFFLKPLKIKMVTETVTKMVLE